MRMKFLFPVLVVAFFGTSAMAKYMTLPASCHYIYSKRADYYDKRDLKCFVKYAAAMQNSKTPINYGAIRLNEVVPSGTTVISKYTILNRKKFNKNLRNGAKKDAIETVCRNRNISPLFYEGLKFIQIFYTKGRKEVKRFTITRKTCGM